MLSSALVYPYELSYFNELVGGPTGGYRYLVNSNLDWGQAAHVMDAYTEAHPDVRDQPPASAFAPSPGRYIVGASYL